MISVVTRSCVGSKMINCFASFLLLCAISMARSQSCSEPDADVLILGAGMSGIAAAHTLNAGGVTDFLILEAFPRIGGRIRQAELSQASGVKVEIGANWIQGLDPNNLTSHPFYSILERCGVNMQDIGNISNYDDLVVYNSKGNRINDSELAQRCNKFAGAHELAEDSVQGRQMNNSPDISVRKGLTVNGWMPTTPEDDWVEWFGFDWCFAETPNVTSLHHSSSIESYSESDDIADIFVTDQRGYVQVVDCLASEFLEEIDPRLHLNTSVSKVQWSDDCVCVEAIENGESRKYCAPYAISTFSIGVLQYFERNGQFDPQLPEKKLDVINTFNMAHFLPIFAEFNNSFWDDVEYIGYVSEERGYFSLFQPLDTFLDGDDVHVLLATFTDEIANRLAHQPIENSTAELVQVLRTIYGSENVTEPTNVLIPDWDVDSHFLGAWTNIPVGVTDETIAQLAEPVGRLYFSGEATSARSIGFSHGAYMAGIDSANAVIEAIEAHKSAASQAVKNVSVLMLCLIMFSTGIVI